MVPDVSHITFHSSLVPSCGFSWNLRHHTELVSKLAVQVVLRLMSHRVIVISVISATTVSPSAVPFQPGGTRQLDEDK